MLNTLNNIFLTSTYSVSPLTLSRFGEAESLVATSVQAFPLL